MSILETPITIDRVSAIPLRIPFSHGAAGAQSGGQPWTALETLLVRVETQDGLVGWGEAFSYSSLRPALAAVEDMVAPLATGREVTDIAAFMRELQQKIHIFGRYGIAMHALSGLDIALWDLAAKSAGLPLRNFINRDAPETALEGYASLYRYADQEMVAAKCDQALGLGYRVIKLHEITEEDVRAARVQIGADIALTVDTNCPWTPEEARDMALKFKPYDLLWLEEPILPPEDFEALAALQRDVGIPLAAGENACTRYQHHQMISAGAVTYVQPSVTKVGGVTEFLEVAGMTQAAGLKLMAHSPYFGPGWLATLQLLAALPDPGYVERLFVDVEASLYGPLIDAVDGRFHLPEGTGLGPDPDPDVIKTYGI